jgi:hypothetical protein
MTGVGVTHKNVEPVNGEVTAAEWNDKHDVPWLSPSEDYLPLSFRWGTNAIIYYDDPYIIIRIHAVTNQYASWLAFGKTYSYGTYEWKAKAANAIAHAHIYLGLFEKHHGWLGEGAIFLRYNGDALTWDFLTVTSGAVIEETNIADVDFTLEHTFKVVWAVASVKLYIDDVLKATHTVSLPPIGMQLFAEVATGTPAPAAEPFCYFRAGSFKEL